MKPNHVSIDDDADENTDGHEDGEARPFFLTHGASPVHVVGRAQKRMFLRAPE